MINKVKTAMSNEIGIAIDENLIVKLPDDGCPGHLGVNHWDVYAARCGEFTLIAFVYDDKDEIFVKII